jgi:hypothetical protein
MDMSCRDGVVFGGACAAAQRTPELLATTTPRTGTVSPCSESHPPCTTIQPRAQVVAVHYERSLPTTVGRMSQEIASQLLVISEPEIRLGERGLITIGEALLGYGRVLFDRRLSKCASD